MRAEFELVQVHLVVDGRRASYGVWSEPLDRLRNVLSWRNFVNAAEQEAIHFAKAVFGS